MPEPRFRFPVAERRGVLLGLDAGQLVLIGCGSTAALALHAVLGGGPGTAAALVLATLTVAAAIVTRDGDHLARWAALFVGWRCRSIAGAALSERPTSGYPNTTCTFPASPPPARPGRRPAMPPGFALWEDAGRLGDGPIGLLWDRRHATVSATVEVGGRSFALLDADEQIQLLEGWRRVLATLARPGGPVTRLQWLRSSRPVGSPRRLDPSRALAGPTAPNADPVLGRALRGYHDLEESALPSMFEHRTWLSVAVAGGTGGRRLPARGAATELRREMRLLSGQLAAAGVDPGVVLDGVRLGEVLASAYAGTGAPGCQPWPLGARETWAAYQTDATWHATYWVAEWPAVDVGPDFLAPLLVADTTMRTAVVMQPVASDRAMREARSARTADLADSELRARAGFLASARRERESEGVAQREVELADGHSDFRFSGYVTVTAPSEEQLVAACADAEHRAQAARIELRRLFGRQAEAFTWTLPGGRGLR